MNLRAELVNSGHKYRKEIIAMPVVALQKTLKHMTVHKGVRGEVTIGAYDNDAELRPYRTSKDATDKGVMYGRTLRTNLGDLVEEFDPYKLFASVYGEQFSSLTERTGAQIVKDMSLYIAKKVGSKLGKALFKARYNRAGNSTTDLFDGFDTIIAKDIAEGNITVAKKNLHIHEEITSANAGDVLAGIYQAASDELRDLADEDSGVTLKMFVPRAVLDAYDEWVLATLGSVSYNTNYNQTRLHCNKSVEIVPLVGLKDSEYIYLTTKENTHVGIDGFSEEEQARIRECDNPKVLQFFMCMFFGVQFESIQPEVFLVSRTTAAPSPTPTPEGSVMGKAKLTVAAAGAEVSETYATATGKGVTAEILTEGAGGEDGWLAVENAGSNIITFDVDAYAAAESGDDPRTAKVRISAVDESGYLDVTVSQAMAEAEGGSPEVVS